MMTHPQVGELLGLSAATVSRMRSGVQAPTLQTMRKIEDVFGYSLGTQDLHLRRGEWTQQFEIYLAGYAANHQPAPA